MTDAGEASPAAPFGDRLAAAVAGRESQVVLGIDPDPARLWPAAAAAGASGPLAGALAAAEAAAGIEAAAPASSPQPRARSQPRGASSRPRCSRTAAR